MKHKYILLIIAGFMCLCACKKDTATQAKVTIVGKWYLASHSQALYYNGKQLGADTRTTFTKDDYSQYNVDGTGFNSSKQDSIASTGFNIFTYKVDGNKLTIYADGGSGLYATINKLTATEFDIHFEAEIYDPINENQTDTQTDDYIYYR